MIALVLSALAVVYLFIPEAIFRLIFGFFIHARNFGLTRGEIVYRAVLITLIPFGVAYLLSHYCPIANRYPFPTSSYGEAQRVSDYKEVMAAFYSDKDFAESEAAFWPSADRCLSRQLRLIFWYWLAVVAESIALGWLLSNFRKRSGWLRWLSDKLFSEYISHWYPLLEYPIGTVQADLLSVDGTLYQGAVKQPFLKAGELTGLILAKPKRFDRVGYLKAKAEGSTEGPQGYWRIIPSDNLYFFADKILNLNLTYFERDVKSETVERLLNNQFGPIKPGIDLKVSIEKPSASSSQPSEPTRS